MGFGAIGLYSRSFGVVFTELGGSGAVFKELRSFRALGLQGCIKGDEGFDLGCLK